MTVDRAGIGLDELRDSVRQVLVERRATHGDQIPDEDGRPVDRDLWRQMASLGWLGLGVEERFGGLGLGAAHVAVVYEELGRSLASVPATTTLLVAQALAIAGSDEQKARWLPAIAAGEVMASMVLPGAPGRQPQNGAAGAPLVVAHVPFADVADLFLLPARAGGGSSALALLPRGEEGVSAVRRATMDLTRSMGEVRVSAGTLARADQLELSPGALDGLRSQAAVAIACDSIGGAAEVLDRTVEYMGVRRQFGRPIGSFQALKHRAANWKVLLEAATALTRHAAESMAAGEGEAAAACAKFYACDTYAGIAGDAIQLHGGIGFTWEHVCHLFLKRAKLNQQLFGSSAEHKERVARLAFAELAAGD